MDHQEGEVQEFVGADFVEVQISPDGQSLWVRVEDGLTILHVTNVVSGIEVLDNRPRRQWPLNGDDHESIAPTRHGRCRRF